MNDMSDALSAAGLLLAALALVYSAWSPSIEAAIGASVGTTDGEKRRVKDAARAIRNRRAWPIAISCWLILIAFGVRDYEIAKSTAGCWSGGGCHYDDIAAVFLLTQLLVLGMAIHAQNQVGRLNQKIR